MGHMPPIRGPLGRKRDLTPRGPQGAGATHPQTADADLPGSKADLTPRGPHGAGTSHPQAKDPALKDTQELGLDLLHLGFDLTSFVDPAPPTDGPSALNALAEGQWLEAALRGLSPVACVGELTSSKKLPRYLDSVQKALRFARKSEDAARSLLPGLQKLEHALDLIPDAANETLDTIRTRIKKFLKEHTKRTANKRLPDISHTFKFPPLYPRTIGDKKYKVKEASGRLGVPGKVRSHREASEQLQWLVSSDSGDDAGHLIGDQFGAPPGGLNVSKADAPLRAENLSRQNWKQNEGGGTFHALEKEWAEKLKRGTGIIVTVRDFFPEGTNRPTFRTAEWQEIAPNGDVAKEKRSFMNTHTPDEPHRDGSRTKQDVKPTVDGPQKNNVFPIRENGPSQK